MANFLQLQRPLQTWFPLTADEEGPALLIQDLSPGDEEDIQAECLHVDSQIKNPDTKARELVCKPDFDDRKAARMKRERCIKGFRLLKDEDGKDMDCTPENIEKLSRSLHKFNEWFLDKLEALAEMRKSQLAVKEKN